ncbi:hypothetical protein NMY22_g2716 [Coprinellus aureogranulatus]|nr:hypothetical protein NMY22_g2716 [Coprinellus aureogranulatus]
MRTHNCKCQCGSKVTTWSLTPHTEPARAVAAYQNLGERAYKRQFKVQFIHFSPHSDLLRTLVELATNYRQFLSKLRSLSWHWLSLFKGKISEMAATRELWFWGDEPNENGQDFLRAFCRTVVEDEQRVEQFVYYLHSGSVADDWYNDLPEDTKKDWNSVKEEFTKRWPIIRRARKTQSQCISELREMKLSEDDLFKKETWGWQRQVYSHVAWACKMEELVRGARLWDTDILLDEIKSRLPRAIKTTSWRGR